MTAVRVPGAIDRATSRGSLLLPFLAAASLLMGWAAPATSQQGGLVVLGLEVGSDAMVPVTLELVRRPGELTLDPVTGTVSGLGVAGGTIPLLTHDPGTGALFAADFLPVRSPGRIRLDPRTGVPTPEGLGAPAAPSRPVLVGLDPTTGSLAAVELSLSPSPGTYSLETRSSTLSPAPGNSSLLGFDPATGALVPIGVSPTRGRGLAVDPVSRRLSATAEAGSGAGQLLGIRADGSVVPVDIDLVHQFGTLAIEPGTGSLVARGEAPGAETGGLSVVGVHSTTGALSLMDIGFAPRPGPYAVNIATGRAEAVTVPTPEDDQVKSGFVLGGGVDVLQMIEFESVLEEVSVGPPNASEFVPGVHVFAEYVWRLISIGAEAGYTVLESEVLFPQGLQRGDLSYLEAGGSLKVRIPIDADVIPYVSASLLGAWIDGDFDLEGLTEARTHSTARTALGAGLDYWATPEWGFRLEAAYNTTFEQDDAAEHLRFGASVLFSPSKVGLDAD